MDHYSSVWARREEQQEELEEVRISSQRGLYEKKLTLECVDHDDSAQSISLVPMKDGQGMLNQRRVAKLSI